MDQIVLKALAKNPQERYQNASEFEKDLHAVLYTYQPSPGPRRPRDLPAPPSRGARVVSDGDEIDAAFDAARDMPRRPAAGSPVLSEERQGPRHRSRRARSRVPTRGARAAPARKRAVPRRETPRAAAEAAASIPAAGESKKSRTGLFAGIGIAAAVLVAVALFVTKDRWSARESRPPGAGPADGQRRRARPPTSAAPSPVPTAEPAKIVDPKAVEAEARRLAAEREKAAREAAAKQAAAGKTGAAPGPAVLTLQPAKTSGEAPKEIAAKPPEPLPVAAPPVVATAVPKPEARRRRAGSDGSLGRREAARSAAAVGGAREGG